MEQSSLMKQSLDQVKVMVLQESMKKEAWRNNFNQAQVIAYNTEL